MQPDDETDLLDELQRSRIQRQLAELFLEESDRRTNSLLSARVHTPRGGSGEGPDSRVVLSRAADTILLAMSEKPDKTGNLEDARAKWISSEYLRSLSSNVSDAQRYFNDLISWSNNLVLANVLAVGVSILISTSGVPFGPLAGLGLFMLTLHHYLVLRSARGYANLIRFTSLQKEVTSWVIEGATEERQEVVENLIKKYHVEWTSPLYRSAILKKVWFSSGAFFHATLITAGIIFCIWKAEGGCRWTWILLGTGGANFILFQLYFWRASYFMKADPYPSARG